ncbi:hypothetical protein C8A03DRAFT_20023, partial [Achaetomium macrosporum]
SPHRAELELETYGREWVTHNFRPEFQPISLPYFLFSDAFGLYSNMYRAILGVYAILAFFPREVRDSRAGILPITLGPFGSTQADIFESLFHLQELDKGAHIKINGLSRFICAFSLAFVGDTPQQQKMSGCRSHNAGKPCRFCHISNTDRSDLGFDIQVNGRYHFDTLAERDSGLEGRAKEAHFKGLGLSTKTRLINALTNFTPALDILRTRPVDVAHSEFSGLAMLTWTLLRDEILLPDAFDHLSSSLRSFPFPPGWGRLQNPKSHMGSWSISEAARASIIAPTFLRTWLEDKHVRPRFARNITSYSEEFFGRTHHTSPTSLLILAFWKVASSSLILGRRQGPLLEESVLSSTIMAGRKAIQLLLRCAIGRDVDGDVPGQRRNRKSQAQDDKMKKYQRWAGLANIHLGLHLPELVQEFGLARFTNTLLGEDKHREYKLEIKSTNHRNAAIALLMRENVKLTINLIMDGCFEKSHPHIHKIFAEVRKRCPALANMVHAGKPYTDLDDEDCAAEKFRCDDYHRQVVALQKVKASVVAARTDPMLRETRPSELRRDNPFATELDIAYTEEYDIDNIQSFGKGWIKWFKRVVFSNG